MSENVRSVGTTRFNYDEIKQEELVSDNIEETTKLANTMLKSMEVFITSSHTQSPLAQFLNVMVLREQMDDIIEQSHNAAMDYLRENEKKETAISYNSVEEADKYAKSETRDGVNYQVLRWANFRNLAPKDKVLNGLLQSLKETNLAVKRIEGKISKRINELRATAEHKKAKPSGAWEKLYVKKA